MCILQRGSVVNNYLAVAPRSFLQSSIRTWWTEGIKGWGAASAGDNVHGSLGIVIVHLCRLAVSHRVAHVIIVFVPGKKDINTIF